MQLTDTKWEAMVPAGLEWREWALYLQHGGSWECIGQISHQPISDCWDVWTRGRLWSTEDSIDDAARVLLAYGMVLRGLEPSLHNNAKR